MLIPLLLDEYPAFSVVNVPVAPPIVIVLMLEKKPLVVEIVDAVNKPVLRRVVLRIGGTMEIPPPPPPIKLVSREPSPMKLPYIVADDSEENCAVVTFKYPVFTTKELSEVVNTSVIAM